MKLYHYSDKRRTELLTLKAQIKKYPEQFNAKRRKVLRALDKWYVEDHFSRPYTEHVSLHIDPLPVDLIKQNFPEESPYFRNNRLYEHVIETDDLPKYTDARIVESAMDTFLYNNLLSNSLYDNVKLYKTLYLRSKTILGKLVGNETYTVVDLNKNISKLKGTIRQYFIDWVNSDDFSSASKQQYSATVPHVFIYPNGGSITPIEINVIDMRI